MEIENILAKNIAIAEDKAAYDAACKRLSSNKQKCLVNPVFMQVTNKFV